jgi:hypothetical protein
MAAGPAGNGSVPCFSCVGFRASHPVRRLTICSLAATYNNGAQVPDQVSLVLTRTASAS